MILLVSVIKGCIDISSRRTSKNSPVSNVWFRVPRVLIG
jgi:hypothetical protein